MQSDGLTVADLCNRFLTAKVRKREAGELGLRIFVEYRETTDLIVTAFGKTRLVDHLAANDFETLRATMAERWGPVRLGNAITRVKSVFKYALDNGLIERPVRFGGEFHKPDKAVLRRHRATNGAKMLEAHELRRLIAALDGKKVETGRTDKQTGKPETVTLVRNESLRAMVLLGRNVGFGNHDIATLPLSALNLDADWVDFPRPKTGIARRCPLWPETIAAICVTLAERPAAKDEADADLVFLQRSGRRWVRNTEHSRTDNVSVIFCGLLKSCGLYRDGLGFYMLRHVFRTIADAARDPVAIDLIMGHTDPSMAGHYRERIEDRRIQAVVEYVRSWLFGDEPDGGNDSNEAKQDEPPTEESEGSPIRDEGDERPLLRLFAG